MSYLSLRSAAIVVVLAALPCPFVLVLQWATRETLLGWFVVSLAVAATSFAVGRTSRASDRRGDEPHDRRWAFARRE